MHGEENYTLATSDACQVICSKFSHSMEINGYEVTVESTNVYIPGRVAVCESSGACNSSGCQSRLDTKPLKSQGLTVTLIGLKISPFYKLTAVISTTSSQGMQLGLQKWYY